MSNTGFNTRNTYQEVTVIVDKITSSGGSDSPKLHIPIAFDLRGIDKGHFEIISIKLILSGTDRNIVLAESYKNLVWRVMGRPNKWTPHFDFLLSGATINKIEKYRKDDVNLTIGMEMQIAYFGNFQLSDGSGSRGEERTFLENFETTSCSTIFTIHQSAWITLLSNMGHNSYKLIELPLFSEVIPEDYSKSIKEFEEARKYFLKGDYDKVVAHCRSALDPFHGKEKFQQLREFITSKSEYDWATKVTNATETWLDILVKETFWFASKTHHTPSIGHFSRTDAEIVLTITTGIIAYIGKIGYKLDQ